MTTVVVIGHVEWVEFLRVEHLPRAGGLQPAVREPARAGGSAVIAASVIAEHGAEVHFIGAVGDDDEGEQAIRQLRDRGVQVTVARRSGATRRVLALLDGSGERSILTVGQRWAPAVRDNLAWDRLYHADGAYVTAGDASVLGLARNAAVLVATPRVVAKPWAARSMLDALVFSANDPEETTIAERLGDGARLLVGTEGAAGGRWWGEEQGSWKPSASPGPIADSYGCGDAFVAGFTLALAQHRTVSEAAELGAQCGADMLTRVGAP
jgi:ribokinase